MPRILATRLLFQMVPCSGFGGEQGTKFSCILCGPWRIGMGSRRPYMESMARSFRGNSLCMSFSSGREVFQCCPRAFM